MAHDLASDEKCRGVMNDDGDRSYLAADRLGRTRGKHVPILVSFLRHAAAVLTRSLSPFWYGPAGKYRPEDHYMRGPGPKCREKHYPDSGI
jgi:hypothetical protein